MAAIDLSSLRERIRALENGGVVPRVLPFAVAALDEALPGGGIALGALHEILGAGADEEDGAVAAAFAAGILARLARETGGSVLWCAASDDLYAPGLAAYGLPPDRLILARCRSDEEILWAMEEGLRSGALAAVLGEIAVLPPTAGRRLQLAAEASGVTALVLRRWRSFAVAERQRPAPSVAVTRWRVAAASSRDTGEPGVGAPLWQVDLLRCRGGRPASFLMEEGDATGHVAVSAELAHRHSDAAEGLRRAG
jgi:protein ImuA